MIKKYKTLKEAEKTWTLQPDEKYYKKMFDFFRLIEKFSGFKVIPGIQKFKTFPSDKPV